MAFSSILTTSISCETSFSSDCNSKSNDFNLNTSFICGSFKPIYVTTNKVTKAIVQCVNIFFIIVIRLKYNQNNCHNSYKHNYLCQDCRMYLLRFVIM